MERMLQSGIKDSVFSSGCFVEVVICAVGEAVTGAEWEQARQTKPDKRDGEGTETTETVRTSSSTASHHLLWDDDEREVLNVKEEKKTPDLMCHLLKLIKAELLSKKKISCTKVSERNCRTDHNIAMLRRTSSLFFSFLRFAVQIVTAAVRDAVMSCRLNRSAPGHYPGQEKKNNFCSKFLLLLQF